MTDEEIRIAVAEVRGWKWSKPHYGHDGVWHSSPYLGEDIWDCDISAWAGEPHDVVRDTDELPNYPYDLNAMHEAEKALTRQQMIDYVHILHGRVIGKPFTDQVALWVSTVRATAPQRAEAFLRTLGKWKEDAS